MFPSNLHKNILQLDRQISLLENECKNMEVDKRKKSFKPEPLYSKCSKMSNLQVKAPPVKMASKNEASKRGRKISSPPSGRLQSAGSLQSHCSRAWSDNLEMGPGRKNKCSKLNTSAGGCSCQKLSCGHCISRKRSKHLACDACKGDSLLELLRNYSIENDKHNQVGGKELLLSNFGDTIQLTLTHKSGTGKESCQIKKILNLEERNDKDGDTHGCQIKGQKWSEILSLDSSKKNSVKENFVKNKFSADETRTLSHPFSSNNKSGFEGNRSQDVINISNNINNLSIQEENFQVPVKLYSPSCKIKNQNQFQINNNKFEKEIQCELENTDLKVPGLEPKDHLKLIQQLVNQLAQLPISELKETPKYAQEATSQTPVSGEEPPKSPPEKLKPDFGFGDCIQNNSLLESLKQHCENLAKDKESLSKELAAKDIIIATMNTREEEYLSLIKSLKLNLEKSKENAQKGVDATKENEALRNKLSDSMKVLDTMSRKMKKAQNAVERLSLENEKLKTQVKIYSLEARKYEVLLAGKNVEIKKYKEEIEKFQRQISEHLGVLKSSAEGVDVEKMMQAIFQQSQLFLQTDLEPATVENDQKDNSKLQNILMHSSPTSTKTSALNSSWKQISSIHDQSNANSDPNLNGDNNAKEFFQMLEENSSSVSKASKKSKPSLIEELLEGKNIKRSLSFTSCNSVHDDDNSSSVSSRTGESSHSSEETISNEEKPAPGTINRERISFEKVQSNIDEVLKNMKLTFSKKILENSITNITTDDFLDSQISSISQ